MPKLKPVQIRTPNGGLYILRSGEEGRDSHPNDRRVGPGTKTLQITPTGDQLRRFPNLRNSSANPSISTTTKTTGRNVPQLLVLRLRNLRGITDVLDIISATFRSDLYSTPRTVTCETTRVAVVMEETGP